MTNDLVIYIDGILKRKGKGYVGPLRIVALIKKAVSW